MTETNTPEAIEFLRRWAPNGPWVLTSIQPDKKGISTRTFYPNDLAPLERWLGEFNGVRNIYFHVNPPTRDLSKKAEREDIKSVDWLHVDIDPRAGEDIEAERERAIRLLREPPNGVPPPTVIVFSGGGYQGFWRLEEPIPVNGDLDRAEDAKRYNQQLEIVFGADNCHNIDRIMRLPGTVNIPDARKAKKGRVPTLAALVEFNDELTYSIEEFTPAPEVQILSDGGPSGFSTGKTVKISGNVERLDSVMELDEWGVPDRIKVIIVQGHDPDTPKEGDNSRSAWLFDAVCGMVRAGVPDNVVYSVITDPDFLISASVIEAGTNMEKYATRQIERAKEHAIEPWLQRLNEKHAVIGNMGGKCRVVEEQMDPTMGRTRLTKQSFDDFRNRYMNIGVEVANDPQKGPSFMPLGKWWLMHAQRRQFENIVFAPNRDVSDAYNLWKGFAVTAMPGGCERFLTHVRDNICRGNEEHYRYIIRWMARAVQKPDTPGYSAIVLRGRQGTGKSFFVKTFGSLWGRHFLQVSDPKHLVGSFNAHLRDCVVLFGDEAFYAGDKKHESILKTLVTEETIMIEGKGVDAEMAPNFVHLILASNSQWVVPAGGDDRRYFVLDVGDGEMQNSAYFKAIAEELEDGGREALLHYLMTLDLEGFDVRQVPKTEALQEQKLLSLSPEEEWWYTKLTEGRLLADHDDWIAQVRKDILLADYVDHMRQVGVQRRATPTAMGKFLGRVCPPRMPLSFQRMADVSVFTPDGFESTKRRRCYFYEFPSLQECRDIWDQNFGNMTKWPETQADMLESQPTERSQKTRDPF